MKRWNLVAGMLCLGAWTAAGLGSAQASATAPLQGSCEFQGLYSAGCVEFIGGEWSPASMQSYCQEQERPGETAAVAAEACKKADYNALCSVKKAGESLANVYVNDLPDFICKKYLKGTFTARAPGGW